MKQNYEDENDHEEQLREEEAEKEARRMFNADYQRMWREKQYREKHGIKFDSLSVLGPDGGSFDEGADYEIADDTFEPLNLYVQAEDEKERRAMMEILQESLAELEPDDAAILLTYYGGSYGIESKMARELGMDRSKFKRMRQKLLKQVQEIFFEKWEKRKEEKRHIDE